MQLHDGVDIFTDNNLAMHRMALAIRGVTESFGLQVSFFHAFTDALFREFFTAGRPTRASTLIICCHGIPQEGRNGFHFELRRRGERGYADDSIDIDAAMLEGLGLPRYELVVSIACASGAEPLAAALHRKGIRHYVAPRRPPAMPASVLVVTALLHRLLYRGGDLASAVAAARAADDADGGGREYALFSAAGAAAGA